jgi:hypothetical protein
MKNRLLSLGFFLALIPLEAGAVICGGSRELKCALISGTAGLATLSPIAAGAFLEVCENHEADACDCAKQEGFYDQREFTMDMARGFVVCLCSRLNAMERLIHEQSGGFCRTFFNVSEIAKEGISAKAGAVCEEAIERVPCVPPQVKVVVKVVKVFKRLFGKG